MAFLIMPHRWRQQPQGAVQIDWSNPLTRGLVFAVVPTQQASLDLIGGQKIATTVLGSTNVSGGPGGVGVDASGVSTSGWGVAYNQSVFRTIGTDFTIATTVDIRSVALNNKLVCVPYSSNSWVAPFMVLSLGRSSTTDQLVLNYGVSAGSTTYSAIFPTGTYGVGNGQRYVASRSGTTATAFVNGTRYDPSSNSFTSAPVSYSTGGRVTLLNHNAGAAGEATDGRLYYSFIWNRALTDAESISIDQDPYQILVPLKQRRYYTAPAIASITATSSGLLKSLGSVASATATIPARTATASATLPKFGALGAATRGIPDRTATSSAAIPKFGTLGAATRLPAPATASSAATLPKFGALAAASRLAAPITATAAAALPRFASAAAATRLPVPVTATAAATLAPFRSSGAATRLPVPAVATSEGALSLFGTLADSTALVPVFGGTASATLAGFSGLADGAVTGPQFIAEGIADWPRFDSRTAGLAFGTDAADIVVVERFTARLARSQTFPVRLMRTARLTARMRTP